jgi:exodeoxyribonuclease VII large subunit
MQLPQYKTVTKLTSEIKSTLERGFKFETIVGEISNFKPHYSGHWYFTLKDVGAQVSCCMWAGNNRKINFSPKDGMQIIISGAVTVYMPRGNYQFDVQDMKNIGVGDLQLAFEILKEKLNKEGLFAIERKRQIRSFPSKIGIVTSSTGAAFQDMVSVATRRFPLVELILAPARVQGEGASATIASAIEELNNFDDIDVIIVGRGGGSLEDLWAFNEETTARAIANSRIPIVSAVGHEIDFTISDFVADLRAATPTAAMELLTPDLSEVISTLEGYADQFNDSIDNILEKNREFIKNFISSHAVSTPMNIIKMNNQKLDFALMHIDNSISNYTKDLKNRLNSSLLHLKSNDHKRILKKGFVYITQDNKFVRLSNELNIRESFNLNFFDGKILIKGKNE